MLALQDSLSYLRRFFCHVVLNINSYAPEFNKEEFQ